MGGLSRTARQGRSRDPIGWGLRFQPIVPEPQTGTTAFVYAICATVAG
jgi:hypothetical protein